MRPGHLQFTPLKPEFRINGVMYNAGMSIAVLAEAGKPVVTRIGFNANQFVLMSGGGDTQYSPFAVVNGQVFISDAFIQDGSITNAKIGHTFSQITMLPVRKDGDGTRMERCKTTVVILKVP